MDTALIRSCLLFALLAGGLAYWRRAALIPGEIAPFASLPEDFQKRVSRRKLIWRGLALVFFTLAALSLFSSLPRGATLVATLVGFYCQYGVFCLRRRYPIS